MAVFKLGGVAMNGRYESRKLIDKIIVLLGILADGISAQVPFGPDSIKRALEHFFLIDNLVNLLAELDNLRIILQFILLQITMDV